MSDKLTPQSLRALARAEPGPFWVGQAKQAILWAADVLEAAEAVIREQRGSKETGETP